MFEFLGDTIRHSTGPHTYRRNGRETRLVGIVQARDTALSPP